jgi:hypothetical protein
MRRNQDLSLAQVAMAANAPMLIKAALVDGKPDVGVLPTGQVTGVVEELPLVADLIARIVAEAEATLTRLTTLDTPDGLSSRDSLSEPSGSAGSGQRATPTGRDESESGGEDDQRGPAARPGGTGKHVRPSTAGTGDLARDAEGDRNGPGASPGASSGASQGSGSAGSGATGEDTRPSGAGEGEGGRGGVDGLDGGG